MPVYTLGIWTVKPGREDEFVAVWRKMAVNTSRDFPGATAKLLRDRYLSGRFVSYGPWESLEQIERWRASATFRDGVARISELVAGFEPHTMDEVTSVG
jgi:heme-degrading monooxygenase HmoA